MPDYELLFPGRFLKSPEFKGQDVTLKIARIRTEPLPQDDGTEKLKPIVSFEMTSKGNVPKDLVLNRTNAECIKAMFGRDTDGWIGKRITFWPAPFVNHQTKEKTTAIRVRGSPDIKADIHFALKLPGKKKIDVTLKAIRERGQAPAPAPQTSAPTSPDPTPPEPPPEPGSEG